MENNENNTLTNGGVGAANPGTTPVAGNQAQPANTGAQGTQPTPEPKKVEISETLLQNMVEKIQAIDGLTKAFQESQKQNAELMKKLEDMPKPDSWYEEQRALFASGKNKKKFIRVLCFGEKFLIGYKNLSANPRVEVLDKMTPDPNDPKKSVATRIGVFYDWKTKAEEEIEVYFPQFIEQCTTEECEVVEETAKEDVFSEGKTIEKTYDEKRGVTTETGVEKELFVKVVRRTYLLKTSQGNMLFSERWINQK